MLGVPPAPAFLPTQMAKRHTSDSLFLRYEPDEAFAAAIDAYRITVLRDQDVVAQVETPELTYRVQNLLPGTSYTLFLLLSHRSVILQAHTSFGWSESSSLFLATLPSTPLMTSPPTATLHASNLLQKVIPPFSISCHIAWEPARDNGSPVEAYRVEFKARDDGYAEAKRLLEASRTLQQDRVDLLAGNRCSVIHDHQGTTERAEGWIEEVKEDQVRVLLDGSSGYAWVSSASVTPLPFPLQKAVVVM